jgi:phosphohistidine phosphatase
MRDGMLIGVAMKTLTIFRHGKSGWDAPVSRDFDRPINERGVRGSKLVGTYCRREGLIFDAVYSSPAVRCVETLDAFWEGYGEILHPNWDKRIYLASGGSLLDWLNELDEAGDQILMCGHNPGCEELALMLAPDVKGDLLRDEIEEKFPTAAICQIEIDAPDWASVKEGNGKIVRFLRPRDLDPSLGPAMD